MRAGNYVHRYFVRQAFEKFKIFSNRPFFVRHCALSADNRQYETLASFNIQRILKTIAFAKSANPPLDAGSSSQRSQRRA
jgi:hypothetical protein